LKRLVEGQKLKTAVTLRTLPSPFFKERGKKGVRFGVKSRRSKVEGQKLVVILLIISAKVKKKSPLAKGFYK
jgi:hypothetical protein